MLNESTPYERTTPERVMRFSDSVLEGGISAPVRGREAAEAASAG